MCYRMLLVACAVVLCACANGLAIGENKMAASRLEYKTYKNGGNYLFNPSAQKWIEASKVCRMYDGHLAFPKTQEEADVLWSIMAEYNVTQVLAGFHDQFEDGEYFTVKGRPLNETSFKQWAPGFPLGGLPNTCGALKGDGLVDLARWEKYPSICEKKEPEGGGGFKDYVFIAGHGFYKYMDTFAGWFTAMKYCLNDGSHLWVINHEDERAAVFDRLDLVNTTGLWVGIHQYFEYQYFVSIFDETLDETGYSKWGIGQPAGFEGQYPYVAVRVGGLYTYSTYKRFVCEYNP